MDVNSEFDSSATASAWPITVAIDEIACMLNFELADDPVYEGGELQWFDDPRHGTGMLVFLSRRSGRKIDYYVQPGLRLDRAGYRIGGGTGSWNEVDFDDARLDVSADGVASSVRFTDVDGRSIEIRVDDRDGRVRNPAGLLAPVGAAIEHPASLMLVWMPRFDLVRATGTPPVIRIDGRDVTIGRLPGARLHRRHLIKYAAPVVVVRLNATDDGRPAPPADGQRLEHDPAGQLTGTICEWAGHRARVVIDPGLPAIGDVAHRALATGRWRLDVDDVRLTGGSWRMSPQGGSVALSLEVDERWKPRHLPWLMRVVTTVVPVFRRWPTTYRWRAVVPLAPTATASAAWERTEADMSASYRRATGS